LGAALGWAERGWPDWALYRPVADAALAARLPLVAADLPRSWIRQPPTFLRQRVLLDVAWGAPLAVALEAELVEAHCGMLPAAALPRMVQAQRARDGHMADRMLAATAAGAGGTVLIAGAGHVRRDRGVPWYLARRDGDISAFVIAFVEVIGGLNDPAAYAEVAPEGPPPFDLLWFTPRVDDRDPCAAHREQLERVKTAG
ncbi:MAG: ChaN family lipoprotein, partial [Alphaproteobacteria bacterium]|nr:ChaN family lipoprotein [Alphaproteobacteria bacterium]